MGRIHWKSTARRDELMVKEFELDPKAEVWIFLDMHADVQTALPIPASATSAQLKIDSERIKLIPSTEEYAVSITASVARYYLARSRGVGIVSSSQNADILSPDKGARHLEKILEFLALLKADSDLPLSALIGQQAQHIPRGSTVVIITPSVNPRIVLGLDQVVRLGLHPVVVLLDANSFGGALGTERIEESVKSMNIPICRVENAEGPHRCLKPLGEKSMNQEIIL